MQMNSMVMMVIISRMVSIITLIARSIFDIHCVSLFQVPFERIEDDSVTFRTAVQVFGAPVVIVATTMMGLETPMVQSNAFG